MSRLELVRGVSAVLNVPTGEVLELEDATLDELAEARESLKQIRNDATTAGLMIDAELVRRADQALATGEDFGETERFRVYVARGGAYDYDSEGLRKELLERAGRGELPITVEAVERAFTVRTKHVVNLSVFNSMCKRWEVLREIRERYLKPKRRTTEIKRRALIESTAEEVTA
jgi:hypothetical protein